MKQNLRKHSTVHLSHVLPLNFSCTGIKFIGDPVEAVRYKQSDYAKGMKRVVSIQNGDESDIQNVDTVDVKHFLKRSDSAAPLGFDLMSMSSARGHFIDQVTPKHRPTTRFRRFFTNKLSHSSSQLSLYTLIKSIGLKIRLNSLVKMSKTCKITLSADVFTTKQNLRKHSTVQ